MEWRPYPKQQEALRRDEFEVLFGGSRGPGKTDAGLAWMLYNIDNPRYRGLVIRKNADDLRDWVSRAKIMYKGLGASFAGKPAEISFPSGARIVCGHLKDDSAYEKYQGHEYHRILLEELTQIPDEERYLKLISSCRSTVDGLPPRVFATTNPGGAGHHWVKSRFVDPSPDGVPFTDEQSGRTRIFIRARVEDNPTIMEKDPEYVKFLESLPFELKKAWRYGDWEVFAGMFFKDLQKDKHLFDPSDIKIEQSWPRFRSMDWGFRDPMVCLWHAVGPDNNIYTYREYYETETLDHDAIREINEMSVYVDDQGETLPENIEYTVGDPNSFPVRIQVQKHGELAAVPRYEYWSENGLDLIMGVDNRLNGWSRMRNYLELREPNQQPMWHISNQCVNLWRELSSAIYHKKKTEDMADSCSDHALDAARYALMSRPPLFIEQKKPITMLEAAERQQERLEQRPDYRISSRRKR